MFYKKCLSFLGACDNCKIFPSNAFVYASIMRSDFVYDYVD